MKTITKNRENKMFDDFKRPEISEENLQKSINDTISSFRRKMDKKGNGAFISPVEILGKLTEEYLEVEEEVHQKRLNEVKNELMDVVVVGLWGIASIEEHYSRK